MRKFIVEFTDSTFAIVQGWDISSAYEFAQALHGKAIEKIIAEVKEK